MNSTASQGDCASIQRKTILIADDHVLVRDGLKLLIYRALGNVEFLEADDDVSIFDTVQQHPQIDLALIDLNMPGMEKGARLADLYRQHPTLPVVVISALTSPDIVRRSLDLPNVHAFVPKSATSNHMTVAINAALQGVRLVFSQSVSNEIEAQLPLTPRMEEVRMLLREGMTNKLIAQRLGISEGTVKNYMSEIFKALKVSNRTQAAQFDPDKT